MKENKLKKERSMTSYLKIRIAILIIFQVIAFALEIVFGVMYFLGGRSTLLLVLFIISVVCGLGCMIFLIYCSVILTRLLYKDIYVKTVTNYDNIAHFHYDLKKYNSIGIKEFNEMNDKLDNVEETYNNVIICTIPKDYSDYHFSYLKDFGALKVIASDDLIKNLTNLINVSRTYRNVFVSFKLKTDEVKAFKKDEAFQLATIINDTFKTCKPLLSFDSKEQSFLLYVPSIDSISILKDKLEYISTHFFITDYNDKENTVIALKISGVVYPYSGLEFIMTHLKYAERKGDFINLYLPDVTTKGAINKNLYSEKIGEFNKLIDIFMSAKSKKMTSMGYVDLIKTCLKEMVNTMNFDCGGIVSRNFDDNNFILRSAYFKNSEQELNFNTNMFTNEFVSFLNNKKDFDSTYVFYDSKVTPPELKKVFDIYDISSGYIYILFKDGNIEGFVYYFNFDDKTFLLDNYSRQSMLYYSTMVGSYFNEYANNVTINHYKKNFSNLLALSHFKEYTINKNNYKIVSFSQDLKDSLKDLEVGDICYKKLYGKNEPCENCPLGKIKKRITELDGIKYLYNVASVKENKYLVSMLLSPIKDNDNYLSNNRFDPVLLLNTTYSLMEDLNNKYSLKSKGYLMLIRFENKDEILKRYKEEGYNDALIYISDKMKEEGIGNGSVYLYSNNCLAILLNECKRNEIFTLSEKIGRIITDFMKANDYLISINESQFVFQYPLTYVSSVDFFRHVEEEMNKEKQRDDNLLIFKEDNIIRPISREAYILQLLEDSFNKHSFDIRILPMVKKDSKQLFGGEILLRLKDSLTGMYIDAYEFIDVAIKNCKMHLFTNLIIEQIGKIYKQYGQTIFRVNCLDRLSINIDSSYFQTDTFVDDIAKLLQEYNFNKNFLSFELNEVDIMNNYDLIKGVVKKLKSYSINFVCDNYSGKFLSLEKLNKLGFEEIKIGREIVKDIDSNPLNLNNITVLSNDAKNYGMKVGLVGIERKEQLEVIKDDNDIDMLQGYYFYKPIEVDEFLSLAKQMLLKIPLN